MCIGCICWIVCTWYTDMNVWVWVDIMYAHLCTNIQRPNVDIGVFPLPLCFGTALLTDLKAYSLARLTWQWFAHLYLPILGPRAHRVRHYFIHGCLKFEYIFMLAKKPLLTTEPSSSVLMVCLIICVSKHTSFWISITKTPQFQVKYNLNKNINIITTKFAYLWLLLPVQ